MPDVGFLAPIQGLKDVSLARAGLTDDALAKFAA